MNLNDKLLYLAGPITGCSFEGCTSWREYVQSKLPEGVKGVSPMRAKDYLAGEQNVADAYGEFPLSTGKGVLTRDRFDVMRADMLLVNLLGADKVSIGTVMEIAWADALRKPVVLVMEPDSVHAHAMVKEACGFIVSDLDLAIKIAVGVLLP